MGPGTYKQTKWEMVPTFKESTLTWEGSVFQCLSAHIPWPNVQYRQNSTILPCHTKRAFNKNLVNKCNTCWLLGLKLLTTSKVSKPGFTAQSELSKGWESMHLKCCPDDSDPQGRQNMHLTEPLWNVWKPLQWPYREWSHLYTQRCTDSLAHSHAVPLGTTSLFWYSFKHLY